MLPYIHVQPIQIGPLTLEPFGLLVAIGCIGGWLVARREARLSGLDPVVIDGCVFWALVPGFFVSRLFELAFYHPETLIEQPWAALYFWDSMSSFGGILGGGMGVLFHLSRTRQPLLPFCDALAVGLIVGFFFGRIGCAIIHDHPGTHTVFLLGVAFPDGPRHDLGLYEWLLLTVICAIVFSLPRNKLPDGLLLGSICIVYAPARFLFDFLRVADRRYYGLTPGQYAAAILFCIGALIALQALTRSVSAGRNGTA